MKGVGSPNNKYVSIVDILVGGGGLVGRAKDVKQSFKSLYLLCKS